VVAGATFPIVVKATLPPGVSGGPFTMTLTATSANATLAGITAADTVKETVGLVTANSVDLSNGTAPDGDPLVDKDHYTLNSTSAVTVLKGGIGEAVAFPLTIQNDSSSPDSFQLYSGGSWYGTVLGPLAPGWTVSFQDATGKVITSTPAIPAGGFVNVTAYVLIPSNPTLALADYSSDINGDGRLEKVPSDFGTDGTYPIFFQVKSSISGAKDIKLDAVYVEEKRILTLVSDQTGQIQPGGSLGYDHTLRNDGNAIESVKLTALQSLAGSGWGNSILVASTNSGIPDTPFSSLTATSIVWYKNAAGTLVSEVLGSDGAIELAPGSIIPIKNIVYAPTSAANGSLDVLTLTVTSTSGTYGTITTANSDQTSVISGQLRIYKTVALDANCDKVADEPFAVTATHGAQPGQCAIWQVVAKNEGTAAITAVVIADTVSSYTNYVAGSLLSGSGDAGLNPVPAVTLTSNTDLLDDEVAANGNFASTSGSLVTYNVGTGATKSAGGSLAAGGAVSFRFSTVVK